MALRHAILAILALGAAMSCAPGWAAGAEAPATANAPVKRVCIPENDTREEIKSHHLLEPFIVLKSASAALKADALRAGLCQIGDEFVYEITLLHRDGRVMHIVMNAVNGKIMGSHNMREPPPKP
jgi:hypothetical protein